ncbi:MAG: tetratricopeptide repeat protein [Desulfobacteraceae bacterium]|jgi:tetratricopeptide (TPR) repeat protein|nr:tetratricopeptide repeat protein [Desulfobacteraceae bacterium]
MTDPTQRYTKTLAKLYADQGHFEKAIEIYQHLVKKFPEREDILDDFSDLKVKMQREKTSNEPELAVLLKQWFDLLAKYRQINAIQKEMNR